MSSRRVVFVTFDRFQSLDLTGPLEVFATANRLVAAQAGGRAVPYRTLVSSRDGAAVRSSSGLTVIPDSGLPVPGRSAAASIDTLVVVGGDGTRQAVADRELIGWLGRVAPRARRVSSVCTGAFLLAEAGLLDGRRATTHWSACRLLARRYPAVTVDPEPIFTRDGDVYTSAGVTAGMDLALALVEQDLGRELALEIARALVLFLRRPGNQAQFSVHLHRQLADRQRLREIQEWMAEHPEADLSVEALAERAAMSPRHFARRFAQEVGSTPGRYVEAVRLEVARRRLEECSDPMELVAQASGFGSAETMRRTFVRRLGVAPAEYRRRFAPRLSLAS
ncbi:MAG TPA: GlxA family transcriptional regulator [Solirubrobacteraceae bacterium]|nr:GlxA family transcriptional regulator [Solirubrobacteraceae bacterium]